MSVKSIIPLKILSSMRYLGLLLIIVGIPVIIYDNATGSDVPLLVGLFTLLIATEKKEDERSVQIKTTSLYFAFILSYSINLLVHNLHSHMLIDFELVQINHFLILTLALANLIYYGRMYVLRF